LLLPSEALLHGRESGLPVRSLLLHSPEIPHAEKRIPERDHGGRRRWRGLIAGELVVALVIASEGPESPLSLSRHVAGELFAIDFMTKIWMIRDKAA
jgi:hypothetical protein